MTDTETKTYRLVGVLRESGRDIRFAQMIADTGGIEIHQTILEAFRNGSNAYLRLGLEYINVQAFAVFRIEEVRENSR